MKNFFKLTFASLIGNLLASGLIFTLGLTSLILLIGLSSSKEPTVRVKNKSILVFDLSTNISDTNPTPTTGQALQAALQDQDSNDLTLIQVLNSIDAAADDRRIVGILLQGGINPGKTGFANLKEIREALLRFKKTGKKIFAYDVDWSKPEYYLGSIADQISLHPSGSIEFNGLSSEEMFYSGALEKFGVGVQVTRVGKYKAAVEPFLRKDFSPENREQTRKLLGDLWQDYLQTVASGRKLTPVQLQQIADNQAYIMPEAAVKSKLIDRSIYPDELVSDLKKITDKKETDKTFQQIGLNEYIKVGEYWYNMTHRQAGNNRIAVVYAEGEIVDGEGSPKQVGGYRLARDLRQARDNDKIKAIVLRVNSPGGSATASEIIQREIVLAKKQKPVIISMGNLAASGGYWISMGADRIFAEPNTITGSIGVFGLLMNFGKIANDNGVTWDVVKTAKYADLDTNSRQKNPEELALIQRMIDRTYDQFITKVAVSRKLSKEKVQEIAQGRVWSGLEAKQIGLVDEIGGINKAIKAAAEKAKLGDKWKVEEYPKYPTFEEQLMNKLGKASIQIKPVTSMDPITAEFSKLQEQLEIFKSLNDPHGIYARLPFNLRIR